MKEKAKLHSIWKNTYTSIEGDLFRRGFCDGVMEKFVLDLPLQSVFLRIIAQRI